MKGGLAAFAVRLLVVLICALASHQRESSTRQGSALCVGPGWYPSCRSKGEGDRLRLHRLCELLAIN